MNKDYTSDIKQVERFMFDNSVYMLNMFEKKVDSFINLKSKKLRDKQLSLNRQENNRIDPNTFFDDPIKGLTKDLTKPIWNCVVKVDPAVFLDDGDCWSRQADPSNLPPMSIYRHIHTSILKHFTHRYAFSNSSYKSQHQDESNLKINTYYCNRNSNLPLALNIEEKEVVASQRPLTNELFGLLMKCIEKENEFLESLSDLGEVQENYKYLRSTLQAYSEVIGGYLEGAQLFGDDLPYQNRELDWFLTIAMQSMITMLDSRNGSTLLTIQPHIGMINLMIHPLIIALHNILQIQLKYNDKNNPKQPNPNNNNKNDQGKDIMEAEDKKNIEEEGVEEQKKSEVVFEQLKHNNCSRVAFINLDGYESEYSLDVVKYLSRNMMYVSFPKESGNSREENKLREFEQYKSERLLRKFFYQSLTEEEKKELLKLHAIEEREFKKNMFILPIHSRSLNSKYELLVDSSGHQTASIQFYESTFIKFMMEQVILSHLREYNPSMIVLSYSGKVSVENEYFVELIKQLTVISNFRLMMYVNQGKMLCFEEKGPEVVAGEDFFGEEEKYYEQYEKARINVFSSKQGEGFTGDVNNATNTRMNLDMLQKSSIFLKVSSGTYNLTRCIEEDCFIQKYKNFKIMRYSALLLRHISKQYPTIEKLKMRANEYLTISKVLKNHYSNKSDTFDKLFDKVISKYHDNLIKAVERLVSYDVQVLVQPQSHHPAFNEEELLVINSAKPFLMQFKQQQEWMSGKQLWEEFKFQYKLQLSTQKTQSRFYLQIPKLKDKTILQTTKNIEDLIAAVEFEIIDQKQKIPVELTANSKILYSKKRMHKEALIYVINHIPKQKASNYFSFVGVLNQAIDQKSQLKIQLKPIAFVKPRPMSQFEHYIDFNFYQTQQYVFMFWPRIFNDINHKIARLAGDSYAAECTWDIFRADKGEADKFYLLKVVNLQSYQLIIPRNGCTCYQPYEHVNRLYLFGGFYNEQHNYLNFQTDVTCVDYLDGSDSVRVENLPKSFYLLNYQNQEMGDQNQEMGDQNQEMGDEREQPSFVREFKNDFIRPRIEFQVFEPAQQPEPNRKQVFLLGGIGQKFMRPYSLISYTGDKLTFESDSTLSSISRIKTNNLLPVNISNATKTRTSQQMNVVTNAQNRNIYINEGMATHDSLVVSYYRYSYDQLEERFDYQQVYEFADNDKCNYREETQVLRRVPTEFPIKYELMASSFRGKEFYNNFIKVSSQNGKKYIFQLMLELSIEVKTTYQNYQKIVRLTGASILAIDINASMLYCLIRHPSYTLDKCILAHYDINELSGKLIDTKSVEIHLKQIHKFDCDVSKNIIIVLNSNTVAVLHGHKFSKDIEIPQMILKKYRKNQIKTLLVKPSLEQSAILSKQQINTHIINQISSSFFINNQGIILCLTFKSIHRQKSSDNCKLTEKVYLRIERLDMTNQEYRWKMVNEKVYGFRIKATGKGKKGEGLSLEEEEAQVMGGKKQYMHLIEVKPNRESKEKREKEFILKCTYNQQIFTGTINTENPIEWVDFLQISQTQQMYYKSIYKQNIKQESIYLQKNPYYYQEVKGISEINYQSMKNISVEINRMDLEQGK